MYPGILTENTLTVILDGRSYSIHKSNQYFEDVKKAWSGRSRNSLLFWVNKAESVKHFTNGKVELVNGKVMYNGVELHNVIVDRIYKFIIEHLPYEPLIKFLDNLMQNPSDDSKKELYTFLEHRALPITEDGYVLAYKAIKNNWKDKHTGTIDNSIGSKVKMDRSLVDDNKTRHCSSGLHVGSIEYVNGFKSNDDRIVIVSFNPRDAVSVPTDANFTKLRVCEYKVEAEYKKDLEKPLYTSKLQPASSVDDDYYDPRDVVSYKDKEYGMKPSGQKYYNKRGPGGRFA